MGETWKVLVTGEHASLANHSSLLVEGKPVEWFQLSVLQYERLPVSETLLHTVQDSPYGWIVFTSPRAVKFWTETLLEQGADLPIETQVACIGETTANAASLDGYTPDFYPTEPGSEQFLLEFKHLLSNTAEKPRVLLVQAEGGRTLLAQSLSQLGCAVTVLPLYRSHARAALPDFSAHQVNAFDAVVFTSPSSVEAFKKHFPIPARAKIGAIGTYTRDCLASAGIQARLLPEGNFQRIGDILC